MYSVPEDGFVVIAKDVAIGKALFVGESHPCQIIFKFTKAEAGKTRIDLVRGSNILVTNNEVEEDIQHISGLIEND